MHPIHCEDCPANIAWTTVNAAEAFPGVVTPLTWSFVGDAIDRAAKRTFNDLGVMTQDQVAACSRPEDRFWEPFYGRAAANVSMFRWLGDRLPGTSGDAIEEQIFGRVRSGAVSRRSYSRYPYVAVKMPRAALRVRGELDRAVAPIGSWWRGAVSPGGVSDPTAARVALRVAAERFESVMVPHTLASMLCQAMYEQLCRLAERVGRPGLELSLITGYGEMAETKLVTDLWEASRDRMSLDEFVSRHGYHGPAEGELSARVWRLDRRPLTPLLESYAHLPEDREPRRVERERTRERERAEHTLFDALPAHRRPVARLMTRLASTFIPLRGTGKAAFLQCVDVARAAALAIGEDLARRDVLTSPEDAFMLTLEELIDPPCDAGGLAAARRADSEEYRKLDIPEFFIGVPEPISNGGVAAVDGDVITGVAVSPGSIEGRARVILDPQVDEPLEPGEILVCRTTDPSWAATMMLASALVIDIGGPISHGAIVARELGIPCVIGSRDARSRIATGDLLAVDGATGEVRILERALAHAPNAKLVPVSAVD